METFDLEDAPLGTTKWFHQFQSLSAILGFGVICGVAVVKEWHGDREEGGEQRRHSQRPLSLQGDWRPQQGTKARHSVKHHRKGGSDELSLALALTAALGVAVVKEWHGNREEEEGEEHHHHHRQRKIWVLLLAVGPYYLSLAILVPLMGWSYVIFSQWICILIPLLSPTPLKTEYDYDQYGIPLDDDSFIASESPRVENLIEAFRKQKMLFLTAGSVGLSCWLVFSSLYYYFEKDNPLMVYCPQGTPEEQQQQCYNRYSSIPRSMYHTVIVLLGEFPHLLDYSTGGQVISVFAVIFGAAVVAIPAGLLGAGLKTHLEDSLEASTPEACLSTGGHTPISGYTRQQLPVITRLEFQEFLSARIGLDHEALYRMVRAIDGHHGEMIVRLTSGASGVGWKVDLGDFARAARFPRVQARLGEYALGSPYGVIDVIAVVPGLLLWFMPNNEYLWALLLLRVFKLERYLCGFAYFRRILSDSRTLLIYMGSLAAGLWLLMSEVMYYTERYASDLKVARYYSTLDGSLWLTLLNVSGESPLGDYSLPGSIITGALGMFAVGVVAVPLGVLGAGMQDRLEPFLVDSPSQDPRQEQLAVAAPPADAAAAAAHRDASPSPFQRRIFTLIYPKESDNRWRLEWVKGATMQYWSRRYQKWLAFCLVISTLVAVLETLPAYNSSWPAWVRCSFGIAETFVVLAFTLDYSLRIYCAPLNYVKWCPRGFVSPQSMRWAQASTLLSLADLLSILPWWLTVFTGWSLTDRYDGEFRLLRLMRIINLEFLSSTCALFVRVVKAQRKCLSNALYVVLAMWLCLGGLLWLAEHNDSELAGTPGTPQAERYSSLISSMVPYAMVHLTGDFPLIDYTPSGKIILALTVVIAVGVTAVPAGLLAAAFTAALKGERLRERQRRKEAAGVIGKHVRRYMVRKRLEGLIVETRLVQMRELAERRKRTFVYRAHCLVNHNKLYGAFMVALILLNIVAVLLESESAILSIMGKDMFNYFELVSVSIFTFDYLARLYSSPANPLVGCRRGKYLKSFLGLVDLMSILPFWIECFILAIEPSSQQFDASIFRVFRIFRILLLEHFLVAWQRLSLVWSECRESVLSTGIFAAIIWLFASCLFYEFEHTSDFSTKWIGQPFDSIPSSMYYTAVFLGGEWGLVDFTPPGKCLCVILALVGVALFSLPAGLVFEAFGDVLNDPYAVAASDSRLMKENEEEGSSRV
ncbi:hypothetical protein FOL47_007240 [Perkinsus chesapeaki]|uniref:Ion transport domain-containing protein n=1 Tax=Perkinsus chesapeaki TaxID=330153 RepID=A0A7J6MWK3_PERCH|nr:hypothetical protein FOL47_007240 [Perkinsus chesapeaki]